MSVLQQSTVEEFYQMQYFEFMHTAASKSTERFNYESPGLSTYSRLEDMFLVGALDKPLIQKYPDLLTDDLSFELQMFRAKYTYRNLYDAAKVLSSMQPVFERCSNRLKL